MTDMKKQLLASFRTVIGAWARTVCLAAVLALNVPLAVTASAQQPSGDVQVTGLVTDQNKEPLIGVTVSVIGGQARTITDMDGMFRLNVPQKSSTELELTYIGFKRKTVKVNGARLINVMMEEEANEFNEVVVTGYTSQKKASIIGSIETINPGELMFGSTRTLSNNLACKLSGVIGIQRSGEPC